MSIKMVVMKQVSSLLKLRSNGLKKNKIISLGKVTIAE
jgi:hypothetical protein